MTRILVLSYVSSPMSFVQPRPAPDSLFMCKSFTIMLSLPYHSRANYNIVRQRHSMIFHILVCFFVLFFFVLFLNILVRSKKQTGGHKSLRGRGSTATVKNQMQIMKLTKQNKTKQNNADDVIIMFKIITMFSYDPHQRMVCLMSHDSVLTFIFSPLNL